MVKRINRQRHSRAVKQIIDGVVFDSGMEADRYRELVLLEEAGQIVNLVCHPRFDLIVGGFWVGHITLDFGYHDIAGCVVEDVKGRVFRDFPLRRNLFKACYPDIKFLVVKRDKVIEVKLKTKEEKEKARRKYERVRRIKEEGSKSRR